MNTHPGATSSNCFRQNMYSAAMTDHQDAAALSSTFSLEPNSSVALPLPPQQNHSTSLVYSLSVLKEKVNQVKPLVSFLINASAPPPPPDHHHHHQSQQLQESTSTTMGGAVASMNNVIQEIIVTASSMMFTCQQMSDLNSAPPPPPPPPPGRSEPNFSVTTSAPAAFYPTTNDQTLDWYSITDHDNYNDFTATGEVIIHRKAKAVETKELPHDQRVDSYDIIELEAADLLAKYTHYCQVCGKGFKRDANLRMHMRAHGDEYKTSIALSNPMKKNKDGISNSRANVLHGPGNGAECSMRIMPRKYSCPQQGCRWNQKHAKFQPLKSMICVKNHYKRSHCPKMYICKRCNQKQFSVLSDLRTHEKHCGDLRWQCSCGTTFSRKDKLMGHVALFVGHTPFMIDSNIPIRHGKTPTGMMQ